MELCKVILLYYNTNILRGIEEDIHMIYNLSICSEKVMLYFTGHMGSSFDVNYN